MSNDLPAAAVAHLEALLRDPDISDEAIDALFPDDLEEDFLPGALWGGQKSLGDGPEEFWRGVQTGALPPLDDVTNLSTANRGVMGIWNREARRQRKQVFDARNDGSAELRVLSEGDSWTQHPKRSVKDVVHHIIDEQPTWAVQCQGAAADWIANIADEGEVLTAAANAEWDAILLSGGGNDLVGKRSLLHLLKRYKAGKPAAWYLGGRFDLRAAGVEASWRSVLDRLGVAAPGVPVVAHGYAYARPDGQKWLGKPMRKLGIKDATLQRAIARELIDRHNEMLLRLQADYAGRFHHVDCRDLLKKQKEWHDELHPKSKGFGRVAARIAAKVKDVTGV